MGDEEKTALKAACIKAAAMMLADQMARPAPGVRPAPDTALCARYARDLFAKMTGEPWD